MAKTILIELKAEDKATAKVKQTEEAVKKLGAQSSRMANTVVSNSQKTNKALTDLGSQFRYMSLVAGLAAAGAITLVKSFVTAAKEFQDAQLKLGVFAISAGESMEETTKIAQNLYATGLVPMSQVSESLANLLATGIGLDKANNLLNVFLDSVVVAKENINDTYGDALVKATLGIRIFQERQIDAIGINTQLSKVFQDYALSIGTVSTNLTNAQKWQAMYNFYMKEGARFAGSAKLAQETLSGALSRLNANMTVMRATLGNALVPIIGTFTDLLRSVSSNITEFAQKFPALTSMLIIGATATTILTAALAGLGALIPLLESGWGSLTKIGSLFTLAFAKTALIVAAVTLAVGGLTYAILKLTGRWDQWMQSMKLLPQKIAETIKKFTEFGNKSTEATEKLRKQLKKLQENINDAVRDFKEGMAEWAQKHDETVTDLRKQINDLAKDYSKATGKIRKDFKDTMSDLELSHARKVEDIERELNEEISKGIWADQTRIRELRLNLKRENEDYERSTKEKGETRDEDLAEEKERHDEKLVDLQEKLNKELELEKKHSTLVAEARTWQVLDEIEKRTRAYQERLKQYREEIVELQGTTSAVNSLTSALNNQANVANVASEKLRESMLKTSAATIANINSIKQAGITMTQELNASLAQAKNIQEVLLRNEKIMSAPPKPGTMEAYYANLSKFNISEAERLFNQNAVIRMPKKYQTGGIIPGTPQQAVPIIAHGGETVLPAGVAPVTVNINNPIVRDEQDIIKIADAVKAVLSRQQALRHLK